MKNTSMIRGGLSLLLWMLLSISVAAKPASLLTMADLQKLVNEARPGDVVEVPGGMYFGTLNFPHPGEEGKPITLKARDGEPVVFNAGRLLEVELSPVDGLPGVWKGRLERGVIPAEGGGIWEGASRMRLRQMADKAQCVQRMASWYYSPETEELWIHRGGESPRMDYWLEGEKPVVEMASSHLRLEGVEVMLGAHGVIISPKARDVEVRHVRAYCNRSAGIHVSGSDHRIVGNEAFHNNMYGIQCRYGLDRTLLKENLCYQNGPLNEETTDTSEPTDLGIYSKGAYNVFEGNVAAGFAKNAYRNKYADHAANLFRGNVVRGNANPARFGVWGNTFIVDGPGPRAGMYVNGEKASEQRWEKADPGGKQRASNLIFPAWHGEDPLFCDPAYYDYRLQHGSPYAGRGANPGTAPVFYVDPAKGDDGRDGRSLAAPLRTLAAAFSGAPAGATVYLLPGEYPQTEELSASGTPGNPLRIRAWGRSGEVVITGGWRVKGPLGVKSQNGISPGTSDLEIEGVIFREAKLVMEGVEGVRVCQVRFEGAEAGVELRGCRKVKVEQSDFEGNKVALEMAESQGVVVSQCAFRKVAMAYRLDAPSGLFADFNGYESTVLSAPEQGESLSRWQEVMGLDRRSMAEGNPDGVMLPGPGLWLPGTLRKEAAAAIPVKNLQVIGLSPVGGTVTWETPGMSATAEVVLERLEDGHTERFRPDMLFQIMGEYFDLSFLHPACFSIGRHFPLSGLKPGAEYRVSVTALDRTGQRGGSATAQFRTPEAARVGRTVYVSPEGDDKADGSSRQKAWGTFYHAVRQLGPGDRLMIGKGVYRERLLPVVSGTEDAPIVLAAEEPGEAVIDLSGGLPVGVEMLYVHDVQVEGLRFRGAVYGGGFHFLIQHASRIRIANCEIEYPEGSSFEKLKAGYHGLVANDAPGLVVEDNLFLCGVIHIGLAASPGAVVRHNTIVGEGNYGVALVPGEEGEPYVMEGNLFHRAIFGYKTGGILRMFEPLPGLKSDYNLFSIPEGDKSAIANWGAGERLATLEQWREKTGFDAHSQQAVAVFRDPAKRDFSLLEGSPGKGAARDGSDIGRRSKK